MYLIFDTETDGLPRNFRAPVTELENWPRLVQLAWVLADEEGNVVESVEYLIKPEGFVIPADATRVHGITTEAALRDGIALATALTAFETCIPKASVLVAHNISFDEKVMGSELLRAGRPNLLESAVTRCTMQLSTEYCQLPGSRGYKWPSLQELHTKLFGESIEGAHNAMVDVRACARCWFELKRRNVVA